MKKMAIPIILFLLFLFVWACSGAKERSHVYYRSIRGPYYGWGHHAYYRDRVLVVPPDGGGGEDLEAVPLPEEPPDMGMPDIDIESFD